MLDNSLVNKKIELQGLRKSAVEISQTRLLVVGFLFAIFFIVLAGRAVDLILINDEKFVHLTKKENVENQKNRSDIVDRNGVLLATSIDSVSLYANPKIIFDKGDVSEKLSKIFEDMSAEKISKLLSYERSFVYIKRQITPMQHEEINKLGIPGLSFHRESKRVFPLGSLTSHITGYTNIDNRGLAGIERNFDVDLRQKKLPVELTIDVRVQHALRDELLIAINKFSALGGAGIVMNVNTGEIMAMVSLPDFNPNVKGNPKSNERFNRATLGIYEMGSTFKAFTIGAALHFGVAGFSDEYDASKPIKISRHIIRDSHPKKRWLSVPEIFQHSSNIGAALLAKDIGGTRQKEFLEKLGLLHSPIIQIPEVGKPLKPSSWRQINTMTIGFGHGIAVSLLQVASAYAILVNGGKKIYPNFVLDSVKKPQEQILSSEVSYKLRNLLRLVVTSGTATKANAKGYLVGGKTGTAEKPGVGGYQSQALISSFVGVFPINKPEFLVVVMLDEPKGTKETFNHAGAGWTAAPTVGKIIPRIAPILSVFPSIEKNEREKLKATTVSVRDN